LRRPEAALQPLEYRPGCEHQDTGPEEGGKERVKDEHAADGDAAQQEAQQKAFGYRSPLSRRVGFLLRRRLAKVLWRI
jgi:hypothetical protein